MYSGKLDSTGSSSYRKRRLITFNIFIITDFVKMLNFLTCIIISVSTLVSLIIVAIGSRNRLKKVTFPRCKITKDLKIILPKCPKNQKKVQAIWEHRTFQNTDIFNGLEHIDMTGNSTILPNRTDLPKETRV